VSAEAGGPELVDVVWRRFGQHIFLTYAEAEGEREYLNGDLLMATDIAEQAGLGIVQSSPATARWVKDPESWHLATEEQPPG